VNDVRGWYCEQVMSVGVFNTRTVPVVVVAGKMTDDQIRHFFEELEKEGLIAYLESDGQLYYPFDYKRETNESS
jgi:hypothetical protein